MADADSKLKERLSNVRNLVIGVAIALISQGIYEIVRIMIPTVFPVPLGIFLAVVVALFVLWATYKLSIRSITKHDSLTNQAQK